MTWRHIAGVVFCISCLLVCGTPTVAPNCQSVLRLIAGGVHFNDAGHALVATQARADIGP